MQPAKLLYENGPDWHYATGTAIADPALFYRSPAGRTHIVVSELEISLMQKSAKVDEIHSFADVRAHLNGQPLTLAAMVKYLAAREKKAPQAILVPGHFPANLLENLRAAGLPLQVEAAPLFFPARALKTPAEIKALRLAQQVNQGAFKHAFAILHASKIRKSDATLLWQGKPLTADILRGEMNAYLVRRGCTEFHGGPIVACGAQGAMPHHRGAGPLKAHQFIVIDCFPRHANGYWGDLTRTVLKGTPTPWHRAVYKAVLGSQQRALSLLKPGADGHKIHQAVVNHLAQAGFPTGYDASGTPYGMFHGTGHGVGLELHDPGPRTLSGVECILAPGMVTSVEPGLYYSRKSTTGGIGGCRIEDVVAITKTGAQNLTTLSKTNWIIP